jgi:hypothetical protein
LPSVVDQLFEDAAAPLDEEFYGVMVTYSDGVYSVSLTAIPETTAWPVLNDPPPHSTIGAARDYSLKAAAVILNGVLTQPQVGHRLTETINSQSQIFEIMPLPDRPAVELLPGGFRWLVHTKRVS